ncbi:MAG: DUF3048 domain-containing protein [Coriobacteriia bacterium]|nr:DUF3048 domain-containing protein [Coriobacteriia bacterium]
MTGLRVRVRLLGFVLLFAALAAGGCASNKQAEVIAVWPQADSERVVPEPPVPPMWPFTGLEAPTEAATKRRPLSVKIENLDAARPQIGLNSADLVYETVVEGGITRFNCIFQSKLPENVGPVRSGRLSDQYIVPQYKGLFFYSGRSAAVNRVLKEHDIIDLSHNRASRAYFRVSNRNAPHNLLLDTKKAYQEAKRLGYKTTATLTPMDFDQRSSAATPTVTRIKIPFSSYNRVEWRYDTKTKKYKRWNSGAVHKDANTGKQITADNVVVMWAKYRQATIDKHGGVTWDIDLGTKGKATIFRNGQVYNATWKADRKTAPVFTDKKGRPVKFTPGRTWFQVIKTETDITMKKK